MCLCFFVCVFVFSFVNYVYEIIRAITPCIHILILQVQCPTVVEMALASLSFHQSKCSLYLISGHLRSA